MSELKKYVVDRSRSLELHNLEKDQLYIRTKGKSVFKVMRAGRDTWSIKAFYLESGNPVRFESRGFYNSMGYFYKVTPKDQAPNLTEEEKKEINDMKKLYKVIKDEAYGTFLTKDSAGNFILEMKQGGSYTNGEVKSFKESELEKVMPFTFSAKDNSGNSRSFIGDKDSVKRGDFLLSTDEGSVGKVYRVTGVDTKDEQTQIKFNGVRLVTETLG